ncbi:S9 family peptidase [Algibacillus agarilyticus]|uniref:S9 family peptidase n=1 Tax=Algibacillus agarilyticus TaxID=2234133 RepID=UPI000DCFCA7E|nr:S9 family peptidase [Algibacillus agarilyticus]
MTFKRLAAPNILPPVAPEKPFQQTHHGYVLADEFHWLKDADYPDVKNTDILDYLNQENTYFKQVMQPHETLVETLFTEFKNREQPVETSVPWRENGFEYRWYFPENAEYRIWARTAVNTNNEQILLDENIESANTEFYTLSHLSISPNNRYMAWSVDDTGSERFTIYIKDLQDDCQLVEVITQTSGEIEWSQNSTGFFYTLVSEEWRPYQVQYHELHTAITRDKIIYTEQDQSYFVGIDKTQSAEFLLISTGSHTTNEVYIVPSASPLQPLELMAGREHNMQYDVDHAQGYFYIRTNDQHENFRIAKTAQNTPELKAWQTWITGSDTHYITGLVSFATYAAIELRVDGLAQIQIKPYQGEAHYIQFDETAFAAHIGNNPEFDPAFLRINYGSMITPNSVYDYHVNNQTLTLKKTQQIPSGYDKDQYITERLWAKAKDGAKIPISIVYKKGFIADGSRPMHLYGYGAYAMAMEPEFSKTALSLLDRGFSYAIAHIRGGDEMGYNWYTQGKLAQRQNTFSDFIDCAEYLIAEKYVSRGNISISGRSAGGELMGAVTVQNPDLWRSVILGVPFVDVLNTMLDDSLPLTPIEWPEWGNPLADKSDYELIASYSPYDNIKQQAYPPMMVTGGLNDPRVTYWEPAKWTAKMRKLKTDQHLLVMRMHMGAGHFSSSGRFARLKDDAEEFTFMLLAHGITA